MPRVHFTRNLQIHVQLPSADAPGETLREAIDAVLTPGSAGRGYVLDDQGALRKHMIIFLDGQAIRDRKQLSDPVRPDSEIYVMQALSGG